MCARNHHSKWWHPFWLSTRMVRRSGFALGSDNVRDCDLARAERAARARNHPTATAFHGCHRFQRCGVGVRTNKRGADVCTKPPLEVVAPILAVDSDGSALGRCPRQRPRSRQRPRPRRARSASTKPPDCDSLSRVPPLPAVRRRAAREQASCRCVHETTTRSGGTRFGCRLGWFGARALPSATTSPATSTTATPSAQRERRTTRLRQPFMGATASSGAESGCARTSVVPMCVRNHH